MSAYVLGKKVYYSPKFVAEQQTEFVRTVEGARAILVVGVNLNEEDTHIWEPLARARAPLAVVNPDFGPYEKWANRAHRMGVKKLFGTATEMTENEGNSSKLILFLKNG